MVLWLFLSVMWWLPTFVLSAGLCCMIWANGSMAIPICDVVATYLCIVSRTLLYDLG